MKGSYIEIDGTRLAEELKKRNLSLGAASREMGYGYMFLTQSAKRGTLNVPALRLMERLYGIKEEDIEPRLPEPVKNEPVNDGAPDGDYDALYRTIYAAVVHAINATRKDGE